MQRCLASSQLRAHVIYLFFPSFSLPSLPSLSISSLSLLNLALASCSSCPVSCVYVPVCMSLCVCPCVYLCVCVSVCYRTVKLAWKNVWWWQFQSRADAALHCRTVALWHRKSGDLVFVSWDLIFEFWFVQSQDPIAPDSSDECNWNKIDLIQLAIKLNRIGRICSWTLSR